MGHFVDELSWVCPQMHLCLGRRSIPPWERLKENMDQREWLSVLQAEDQRPKNEAADALLRCKQLLIQIWIVLALECQKLTRGWCESLS